MDTDLWDKEWLRTARLIFGCCWDEGVRSSCGTQAIIQARKMLHAPDGHYESTGLRAMHIQEGK